MGLLLRNKIKNTFIIKKIKDLKTISSSESFLFTYHLFFSLSFSFKKGLYCIDVKIQ